MPKKQGKELRVTDAAEWRESQRVGQLVELPSGKVARLTRPHMLALAKTGQIPDPLSAQVMEMFSGKKSPAETKDSISPEDMLALINITCKIAFVEPKIADDPGPDELSIDDIDFEDRTFVFWWSQGGAADLASFRKEQERIMEVALGGKQVPPKAERTPKSKR